MCKKIEYVLNRLSDSQTEYRSVYININRLYSDKINNGNYTDTQKELYNYISNLSRISKELSDSIKALEQELSPLLKRLQNKK